MNIDLDVGIEFLLDKAKRNNNLDICYSSVSLENGIFQRFNEVKKEFSFSYGLNNSRDIVDSGDFFGCDSYRFVLFCYLKILDRIPSKIEINTLGKVLENKGITKLEALRNFAFSEEAEIEEKKVVLPEYKVEDFLRFYDEEFVENCYVYILKRFPREDEKSEIKDIVRRLRTGDIDRFDVLHNFLNSEELKKKNIRCKIAGLEEAYLSLRKAKKKFKIPFIGKILRITSNIINSNRDLHIETEKIYGVLDNSVKKKEFGVEKKLYDNLQARLDTINAKVDYSIETLNILLDKIARLENDNKTNDAYSAFCDKEIEDLEKRIAALEKRKKNPADSR